MIFLNVIEGLIVFLAPAGTPGVSSLPLVSVTITPVCVSPLPFVSVTITPVCVIITLLLCHDYPVFGCHHYSHAVTRVEF